MIDIQASQIRNKPIKNVDPNAQRFVEMQSEITVSSFTHFILFFPLITLYKIVLHARKSSKLFFSRNSYDYFIPLFSFYAKN